MDRPHWPQEIVVKPMEETLVPNSRNSNNNNSNNNNNINILSKPSSSSSSFERRARPQNAATVNCPRCDSTNTKFCYYNNYSLSQPRYFCKTCRRYWTAGGTLRNIPVGGGSRKNKRSSTSTSTSATSLSSSSSSYSSVSKTLPDLVIPQNPRIHHDQYGQDLNLGFQVPNFDATRNNINTNPCVNSTTNTTTNSVSALELLTGITSRGATNSFMPIPDPNSVYTPSGQLMVNPMPEFKIPSLSFSLDGMGMGSGGSCLFPFEELKTSTISGTTTHDDDPQSKDQNCDSNGFWNGMMGGGSW